jgi:hypothetical protein
MVELGILGLGLSLAATAGFIALGLAFMSS